MKLIFILILSLIFPNNWKYSKITIPENFIPDQFQVYTGLDVLELSEFNLLKGKRIALVVNHTSVNRFGKGILEILKSYPKIKVKTIFTPEHGFFGKVEAGKKINSESYQIDDYKIISLYGKSKKPKIGELKDIDLVLFDIQDIGSRFYTYASTMSLVMEACAQTGIQFLILDRPNPLGGTLVQGPSLQREFSSFVGMHPFPIRHGQTIGELALIINESSWLKSGINADLTIIPAVNWQRKDFYSGPLTGWVPPSPNIPDLETAIIYSGMCLFEGTNISEGRGTDSPFKLIGAPWLDPKKVIKQLGSSIINGIEIKPIQFIPQSIPGKSQYPKFLNENCNGLSFNLLESEDSNPIKTAVNLMFTIKEVHGENFEILDSHFLDKLYGSDKLRKMIQSGGKPAQLFSQWDSTHYHVKPDTNLCAFISPEHYFIYPIN